MRSAPARSTVPPSTPISPESIRSSVVFPVPLSPTSPNRVPAVFLGDSLHGKQAFGTAVGGREIDLRHTLRGARLQVVEFAHQASRVIDARFGFSGPRLRPAP